VACCSAGDPHGIVRWSQRCAALARLGELFEPCACGESATCGNHTVTLVSRVHPGHCDGAVPHVGVVVATAALCPAAPLPSALAWSRLLLRLLVTRIRLYRAQAIVSTLGGAWFQSSDYTRATVLAAQLLGIARELGHVRMALQARLYIAYNAMMRGHFAAAGQAMRALLKAARDRGDTEVIAMAVACLHRLGLERRAARGRTAAAARGLPLDSAEDQINHK
jgi:hypothetical protein